MVAPHGPPCGNSCRVLQNLFIMENPDKSFGSYIRRKCLDLTQVPALKGDHSHTRQAMVLPKDKDMLCLPPSSQARSQEDSSNSRVLNEKEMRNKFCLYPKLQYAFFLHPFFTTTGQEGNDCNLVLINNNDLYLLRRQLSFIALL